MPKGEKRRKTNIISVTTSCPFCAKMYSTNNLSKNHSMLNLHVKVSHPDYKGRIKSESIFCGLVDNAYPSAGAKNSLDKAKKRRDKNKNDLNNDSL